MSKNLSPRFLADLDQLRIAMADMERAFDQSLNGPRMASPGAWRRYQSAIRAYIEHQEKLVDWDDEAN